MTEGTPDGRTFDNRAGCAARLERDNQELRTRLQRAEELLRASRGFVADPNLYSVTGFTFVGTRQDCVQQIDAYFGEGEN